MIERVTDHRALVVAIYHLEDEPLWRTMERTLSRGNAQEVCIFRELVLGGAERPDPVEGADVLLPLVSRRSVEAKITDVVRAHEGAELCPVRVDDVDIESTGFSEWQMVPEDRPFIHWPIEAVAARNVAETVIDCVNDVVWRRYHDFTLSERLRVFDYDKSAIRSWIAAATVSGGVASVIWWAFTLRWLIARWSFAGLAVVPAVTMLIMAWRSRVDPDLGAPYDNSVFKRGAVVLASLLPSWLTAPLVYLALQRVEWWLIGRDTSRSITTTIEVALVGSALFGALTYLSTRRRRRRGLVKRRTPQPTSPHLHVERGAIVYEVSRSGDRDYRYVVRVPSWRALIYVLEMLAFVTLAWTLFRFLYPHISNFGALWIMYIVVSVTVTTWTLFGPVPPATGRSAGRTMRGHFRIWWLCIRRESVPWVTLLPMIAADIAFFFEKPNGAPPAFTVIAITAIYVNRHSDPGRVVSRSKM